jgi:hypothetical protein
MEIATRFEKVQGPQVRVGIWIITQLKDPVSVFVPVPGASLYPEGYNRQSDRLPLDLRRTGNLLSLLRDPRGSHKIGNDAGALLWIGPRDMLLIRSPRVAGASYPDQGSSAEVYTNMDPLPYVELELLGPLHDLKPGDRIEQTNHYTLMRRTGASPVDEARRVLGEVGR